MLQNNPALKSKIDQLWNKFWAGGIANPLTAIEQITYLLLLCGSVKTGPFGITISEERWYISASPDDITEDRAL